MNPSPAGSIEVITDIIWLERGVKKRGGKAPSQILYPFQTRNISSVNHKTV